MRVTEMIDPTIVWTKHGTRIDWKMDPLGDRKGSASLENLFPEAPLAPGRWIVTVARIEDD